MSQPLTPIIIDTDMASDDWMAILYLLQSPLVDVKAITIAATGQIHTRPGVRTGLRLLQLAHQVGIPITAGRSTPLQGNNTFPWLWRIGMDCRLGLHLPRTKQKRESEPAVDLMGSLLTNNEQPMTIIALGPLTNVGELLEERPDLVENIANIVIMGGALHVPGNIEASGSWIKNPHAEWNIYVDPRAANIVFDSGVPTILAPLDVTNQAPLTIEFFERLNANRKTPAADFVCRILQRLKPMLDKNELYFWDPLTAVVATHPQIFEFTRHPVRVIEPSGPECGRTIVAAGGPSISVCSAVDQQRFEEIFLATLNATISAEMVTQGG